jgi:hypothetical protein
MLHVGRLTGRGVCVYHWIGGRAGFARRFGAAQVRPIVERSSKSTHRHCSAYIYVLAVVTWWCDVAADSLGSHATSLSVLR